MTYYNGRKDVLEPEDFIGVESISLSTNASDGRRFVTLDLEIPVDLELDAVEKLMVCLPDGTTPRLFIPKAVVPIAPAADAPATAPASDAAPAEPATAAVSAALDEITQEVPVVSAPTSPATSPDAVAGAPVDISLIGG